MGGEPVGVERVVYGSVWAMGFNDDRFCLATAQLLGLYIGPIGVGPV